MRPIYKTVSRLLVDLPLVVEVHGHDRFRRLWLVGPHGGEVGGGSAGGCRCWPGHGEEKVV